MSPSDGIERYAEVDSTMEMARRRAAAGAADGTVVVAERQTSGRGRRGRSWFSPQMGGVWLTMILRPPARLQGDQPLHFFGLVAGVAVHRALCELGAHDLWLKWPNDVVTADGRKLAGILLEAEDVGGRAPLLLAGLGINLTRASELALPKDIVERYVGLEELTPTTHEDVLQAVTRALRDDYDRWLSEGPEPTIAAFSRVDFLKDQEVRCELMEGPVVGVARGVTPLGALLVETENERLRVTSGEVVRVRQSR